MLGRWHGRKGKCLAHQSDLDNGLCRKYIKVGPFKSLAEIAERNSVGSNDETITGWKSRCFVLICPSSFFLSSTMSSPARCSSSGPRKPSSHFPAKEGMHSLVSPFLHHSLIPCSKDVTTTTWRWPQAGAVHNYLLHCIPSVSFFFLSCPCCLW